MVLNSHHYQFIQFVVIFHLFWSGIISQTTEDSFQWHGTTVKKECTKEREDKSSYVLQYTRRRTKWDIISLFRTWVASWCLIFTFHRSFTCTRGDSHGNSPPHSIIFFLSITRHELINQYCQIELFTKFSISSDFFPRDIPSEIPLRTATSKNIHKKTNNNLKNVGCQRKLKKEMQTHTISY